MLTIPLNDNCWHLYSQRMLLCFRSNTGNFTNVLLHDLSCLSWIVLRYWQLDLHQGIYVRGKTKKGREGRRVESIHMRYDRNHLWYLYIAVDLFNDGRLIVLKVSSGHLSFDHIEIVSKLLLDYYNWNNCCWWQDIPRCQFSNKSVQYLY